MFFSDADGQSRGHGADDNALVEIQAIEDGEVTVLVALCWRFMRSRSSQGNFERAFGERLEEGRDLPDAARRVLSS